MSVLISDAEYKGLYDIARNSIDTIPRKVIDDAIAKIERYIQMLENEGNDAVDLYIAKGASAALNVAKELEKLPPVQPMRKRGKWVPHEVKLPDRKVINYTCSVCGRKLVGYSTETLKDAPFCHCGADMREVSE